MITAEIIAIGNEVLLGDVQDTNTHWLCRQIARRGGRVQRAVVVRDALAEIGREVRSALARQADLIVTTGGLGPTEDDMSLRAVALALGRELELNQAALDFITQKYRALSEEGSVDHAEITSTRRKMAMLPAGATSLDNPVGAAPGALLHEQESVIVCLPGVPSELKGIFENALKPALKELFGEMAFAERLLLADCGDESVLAPLLKQVVDDYPNVYVKSRAGHFGPDVKFRITLSTTAPSQTEVEQRLDEVQQALERVLADNGIALEPGEGEG